MMMALIVAFTWIEHSSAPGANIYRKDRITELSTAKANHWLSLVPLWEGARNSGNSALEQPRKLCATSPR